MGRTPMRRRRIASTVVALAVATVALAGCIGIPTGGGVQTGEVVVGVENPPVSITPADPKPGSEPVELLEDFMRALRGPQGGYAVARKYLTTAFADEWNP